MEVGRKINIRAGNVEAIAELNDSDTANAIWEALPIKANGSRWGDEIYFGIPVRLAQDAGAKEVVDEGDLGYWPPGHAFCIFWGPTPASVDDEARAASPVNIFGHITGDAKVFGAVRSGTAVSITRGETR
jgi:hypothetical protein